MIDFINLIVKFAIVTIAVFVLFALGWRGILLVMTGYTLIPFFPFIIRDYADDRNSWLGFRDMLGNNRLHLAILSSDYKKIHWLSLSKYLRETRNSADLLPSDLIDLVQDKELRVRILKLFEERALAEQRLANRGEKASS